MRLEFVTYENGEKYKVYTWKDKIKSIAKEIYMWEHWQDAWVALLLTICSVLTVLLFWAGVSWFGHSPVLTGYRIEENTTSSGSIKYYQVIATYKYGCNVIILSTPNIDMANEELVFLRKLEPIPIL